MKRRRFRPAFDKPYNSKVSSLDAKFQEGLALHQQGRLSEAKKNYEAALKIKPDHADTLNLLGVLYYQTGRPDIAVKLISDAIEIAPFADAYMSHSGRLH